MKSIKSKEMIRNYLKEIDINNIISNNVIWTLQEIKGKLELVDEYIKIYLKTKFKLLKTFLKELIKIENKSNFKMFVYDNEGIKIKEDLEKMLCFELLKIGGYDKPMKMEFEF
jgi:hypothetical protein